jgi:hypothetical protein
MSTFSFPKPPKVFPIWYFWFEKTPSGNPAPNNDENSLILRKTIRRHLNAFGNTASVIAAQQGCQMVCFQTKNSALSKFWKILQKKILVYFMTIWSILRPLEITYGHLVFFVVIW